MVYQLNWMLIVAFLVAALLHIPHPVTGNLRGTPEGVCFQDLSTYKSQNLRGFGNSTLHYIEFVKSEDYILYNNNNDYKYEFHTMIGFE